jgi:hypothetical protein
MQSNKEYKYSKQKEGGNREPPSKIEKIEQQNNKKNHKETI